MIIIIFILFIILVNLQKNLLKKKRGDALKSSNFLKGKIMKYRSQSILTPEKIKMIKEAFGDN
jgi:hypothetical protein